MSPFFFLTISTTLFHQSGHDWHDAFSLPRILLLLVIMVLGYAEIHLRLPGLRGRLFHREPEILFDLPFRSTPNSPVPLFLIVKDADRFPVETISVQIVVQRQESAHSISIPIDFARSIRAPFYWKSFFIEPEHFPHPGTYEVTATLHYRINGENKQLQQDNYRGLPHPPFRIQIAPTPLPRLPNLYWGDLHVHSNYTDDPVEFGAPIKAIAQCAHSLGLHFVAITDHSFDLERGSNPSPSPAVWQRFQKECREINDGENPVLVMAGEEVSAGNHKGRNVHCLVLGSPAFFPGNGDGKLNPFTNRPTLPLPDLFKAVRKNQSGIIAAAHPFDVPPLSQKLLLNRDGWHATDLHQPELDYWQILNGRINRTFYQGKAEWVKALLNGLRVGILGGTDAHGNFNCFRQVAVPLWRMNYNRQQLLGQTRTGVFCETSFDQQTLLNSLREKRVIVSTGPAANLNIHFQDQEITLGGTIPASTPCRITVQAVSTPEFGPLSRVRLYTGDDASGTESCREIEVPAVGYELHKDINFPEGFAAGYVRLEVFAGGKQGETFCLSNPVWVANVS